MFNQWKVIYVIPPENQDKAYASAEKMVDANNGIDYCISAISKIYGKPYLVNLKTGEIKPVVS